MEEEERNKKLRAGKEKLAQFQKKRKKKKSHGTPEASKKPADSELCVSEPSDISSSMELSSGSDLFLYDSDSQSLTSLSEDETAEQEAQVSKSLLGVRSQLRDKMERVAELEESLMGKQLALDSVIRDNEELRRQAAQQAEQAEQIEKTAEVKQPSGNQDTSRAQELVEQSEGVSNGIGTQAEAGDGSAAENNMADIKEVTQQVQWLQLQLKQAGSVMQAQTTRQEDTVRALNQTKDEFLALQDCIAQKDQVVEQLTDRLLRISAEYTELKVAYSRQVKEKSPGKAPEKEKAEAGEEQEEEEEDIGKEMLDLRENLQKEHQAQLETMNADKDAELKYARQELQMVKDMYERANLDVDELMSEVQALKSETERVKFENDSINEKLTATESEKCQLVQECEVKNVEIDSLIDELEALKETDLRLKDENFQMKDELQRVKAEKDSLNSELQAVTMDLDATYAELKTANDKLNETLARNAALENQLVDRTAEVESVKLELDRVTSESDIMSEEVKWFRREHETAMELVADCQAQIAQYENKISQSNDFLEENHSLRTQNDELYNKINNQKDVIAALRSDLEVLSCENVTLTDTMNDVSSRCRQETEMMEEQKKELMASVASLSQTLQDSQANTTVLTQQFTQQIEDLKRELADSSEQCELYRTQVDVLKAQPDGAKSVPSDVKSVVKEDASQQTKSVEECILEAEVISPEIQQHYFTAQHLPSCGSPSFIESSSSPTQSVPTNTQAISDTNTSTTTTVPTEALPETESDSGIVSVNETCELTYQDTSVEILSSIVPKSIEKDAAEVSCDTDTDLPPSDPVQQGFTADPQTPDSVSEPQHLGASSPASDQKSVGQTSEPTTDQRLLQGDETRDRQLEMQQEMSELQTSLAVLKQDYSGVVSAAEVLLHEKDEILLDRDSLRQTLESVQTEFTELKATCENLQSERLQNQTVSAPDLELEKVSDLDLPSLANPGQEEFLHASSRSNRFLGDVNVGEFCSVDADSFQISSSLEPEQPCDIDSSSQLQQETCDPDLLAQRSGALTVIEEINASRGTDSSSESAKLSVLESENWQLKDSLKSLTEERDALVRDGSLEKERMSEVLKMKNETDSACENLKSEVESQSALIQNLRKEIEDKDKSLSEGEIQLSRIREQSTSQKEELQTVIEIQEEKLRDSLAECSEMKEVVQDLTEKVTDLKLSNEQNSVLQSKLDELMRDSEQLRSERDCLTQENETLMSSCQNQEDELTVLESNKNALENENQQLKMKLSEIESEICEYKSEHNGEVEKLRHEIELLNNQNSELRTESETLNEQTEELTLVQQKCADLETEVGELVTHKTEIEKCLAELNAEHRSVTQEKKALTEQCEHLQQCVTVLEEEKLEALSARQSEVAVEAGIQTDSDDSAATRSGLEVLETENQELKDEIRSLKADLQEVLNQTQALDEKCVELSGRKGQLDGQVEDLRKENSEYQIKITSLEQDLLELVDQVQVYDDVLTEKADLATRLEGEVTKLLDENSSLSARLDSADVEFAELSEHHSLVKGQLHTVLSQQREREVDQSGVEVAVAQQLELELKMKQKLQKDLERAQAESEEAKKDVSELTDQLEMVCNELKNLEKEFKEQDECIHRLEQERQAAVSEKDSVCSEMRSLEADFSTLLQQRDHLTGEVETLQMHLNAVSENRNHVRTQIEILASELESVANSRDELASRYYSLERQNRALRADKEENMGNLLLVSERVSKFEQLFEEKLNVEGQNVTLSERITQLGEKVARIEKEKEELEIVVDDLTSMLHDMQLKYEEVQSEMEATKKKCDNEIGRLQSQLTLMSEDVHELRAVLDFMENEMSEVSEEKTVLKENLEQQLCQFSEIVEEKQKLEEELSEKHQKDLKNQRTVSDQNRQSSGVSADGAGGSEVADSSDSAAGAWSRSYTNHQDPETGNIHSLLRHMCNTEVQTDLSLLNVVVNESQFSVHGQHESDVDHVDHASALVLSSVESEQRTDEIVSIVDPDRDMEVPVEGETETGLQTVDSEQDSCASDQTQTRSQPKGGVSDDVDSSVMGVLPQLVVHGPVPVSVVSVDSGVDSPLYERQLSELRSRLEQSRDDLETLRDLYDDQVADLKGQLCVTAVDAVVQTELGVDSEEIVVALRNEYEEKCKVLENEFEAKEKELEEKLEQRLEQKYEFRERKVKALEDNYESKVKQMEYDIEERFIIEMRNREAEIMCEADQVKRKHADSVEAEAKRMVESIKKEKDQEFVETMRKVHSDLKRKHKKDLEKLRRDQYQHQPSASGDRAPVAGDHDEDVQGQDLVSVVDKLNRQNQKLAEAHSALLSQMGQTQQHQQQLCHDLVDIVGDAPRDPADVETSGGQTPSFLDWNLAPEFSFGSHFGNSSLGSSVGGSLEPGQFCTKADCQAVKLKYDQLIETIEKFRAQVDSDLAQSGITLNTTEVESDEDLSTSRGMEENTGRFVEDPDGDICALQRITSIHLEHSVRGASKSHFKDDQFINETEEQHNTEGHFEALEGVLENIEGLFEEHDTDTQSSGEEDDAVFLGLDMHDDLARASSLTDTRGGHFSESSSGEPERKISERRCFSESGAPTDALLDPLLGGDKGCRSLNLEGHFVKLENVPTLTFEASGTRAGDASDEEGLVFTATDAGQLEAEDSSLSGEDNIEGQFVMETFQSLQEGSAPFDVSLTQEPCTPHSDSETSDIDKSVANQDALSTKVHQQDMKLALISEDKFIHEMSPREEQPPGSEELDQGHEEKKLVQTFTGAERGDYFEEKVDATRPARVERHSSSNDVSISKSPRRATQELDANSSSGSFQSELLRDYSASTSFQEDEEVSLSKEKIDSGDILETLISEISCQTSLARQPTAGDEPMDDCFVVEQERLESGNILETLRTGHPTEDHFQSYENTVFDLLNESSGNSASGQSEDNVAEFPQMSSVSSTADPTVENMENTHFDFGESPHDILKQNQTLQQQVKDMNEEKDKLLEQLTEFKQIKEQVNELTKENTEIAQRNREMERKVESVEDVENAVLDLDQQVEKLKKEKMILEQTLQSQFEEDNKNKRDKKKLKSEVEKLRQELENMQEELKREKSSEQENMTDLASQLEAIKAEKDELSKHVETMSLEKEKDEGHILELKADLEQARKEISSLGDSLGAATEIKEQCQASIQEMTATIDKVQVERDAQQQLAETELNAAQIQIENLQQQVSDFMGERHALSDQQVECKHLQGCVEQMEKELKEMSQKNSEMQENAKSVEDMENTVLELDQQVEKLKKDKAILEQMLQSQSESDTKHSHEKEQRQLEIHDLRQEIESMKQSFENDSDSKAENLNELSSELDTMRAEKDELSKQVESVCAENQKQEIYVTELKADLDEVRKENVSLEKQLEAVNKDCQAQLKDMAYALENAKTEKDEIQQTCASELNSEQTMNESLQQQVSDLNEERDSLLLKLSELEKLHQSVEELEKENAGIAEKNKELQDKTDSLDAVEKAISELDQQVEKLKKDKIVLEQTVQSLNEEDNTNKSEKEKLNLEIEDLKQEIENVQRKSETDINSKVDALSKLSSELDSVKTERDTLSKHSELVCAENQKNENHIANLTADLDEVRKQNVSLEQQLETVTKDKEDCQADLKAISSELESAKTEKDELQQTCASELNRLQKINDGLQQQVSELNEEKDSLLQQLAELEKLQQLVENLEEENAGIAQRNKELQDKTESVEAVENAVLELDQQVEKLKEEKAHLEQTLQLQCEADSKNRDEKQNLELEIQQLKLEMQNIQKSDRSDSIHDMESQLNSVRAENDELSQRVELIQRENQGYATDMADLNTELDLAKKEISSLKKLLDSDSNVKKESQTDLHELTSVENVREDMDCMQQVSEPVLTAAKVQLHHLQRNDDSMEEPLGAELAPETDYIEQTLSAKLETSQQETAILQEEVWPLEQPPKDAVDETEGDSEKSPVALLAEIQQLQSAKAGLEETLNVLLEEKGEHEIKMEDLHTEVKVLEAEKKILQDKIHKQMTDFKQEKEQLVKMYSDLKSEIEPIMLSKQELEEEVKELHDLQDSSNYEEGGNSSGFAPVLTVEDLEEMEELKNSISDLKRDMKEKDVYVRKLEEHLLTVSGGLPDLSRSHAKPHLLKPNFSQEGKKKTRTRQGSQPRQFDSVECSGAEDAESYTSERDEAQDWRKLDIKDLASTPGNTHEESTLSEGQFVQDLHGSETRLFTSSLQSDVRSVSSVADILDGSERIRSGLGADEDGHLALELKQFELVDEISKLNRDLRETKAIYAKETACLSAALEEEKMKSDAVMNQSKKDLNRGKQQPSANTEVGSSKDAAQLRQDMAVLREENKMLRVENDRILNRLKEQESLVLELRERLSRNSGGFEEVEEVFGRQLALLQKQREELVDQLRDAEYKNRSLSTKIGEKAVMEESIRREKDILTVKLQEKANVEAELREKQVDLEKMRQQQKLLEEKVYQKDLAERKLMKQKRLLEQDLLEIEAKLREREEYLGFEKNQLLQELKECKVGTRLKSRLSESEDDVRSVCSDSSGISDRHIGRLEIMLEEVEKQHAVAVSVLRDQLKSKYKRRESALRDQHVSSLSALRTGQENQVQET